ncbi:MAG: hypothetical protein JXR96_30240, partial [Deltaproteobacteria bacterium]|nr:hypothetical protein [Deltaproteobacteria bacterium]
AVFEFPLHSSCYFSLYNTHLDPCDIPHTIQDYIIDRQETFRSDLKSYLLDERSASEPFWIYPPIYAGDMNTHDNWEEECNIIAEDAVWTYFFDTPYEPFIDKVWLGKPVNFDGDIGFTNDVNFLLINPEKPLNECSYNNWPFKCRDNGYVLYPEEGEENIYSDHGPNMIEIMAPEQ